jgi:arylsulfatase A-like enzyme
VYPDLLESAGYHVGFTRKGWSPGTFEPGGRKRNPAGPKFESFEDFLAARKADAPFCFWFGSTDPHRPYETGSGVKSGMRLEDVRVPPYLPDNEIIRGDICDYFWKVQRYDRDAAAAIAAVERWGELDNTIIVMSGDNGWPFPRCKATCYDTGTHAPLAISWPAHIKGGRTVEDFVSLTDLAPTYLEAADVKRPAGMTGRSLMPVLTSGKSGSVDPKRDHVLTGMERHVPSRGAELGGYPTRTIRTRDYHYIVNFAPERWPAGDPNTKPVTAEEYARTTFVGFADIDAGPSKGYVVTHRDEPYFKYAAAKRPPRELYDLRSDPYELRNVAGDPKYKTVADKLGKQLMAELRATGDPRASGGGDEFDRYIWYQGRTLSR